MRCPYGHELALTVVSHISSREPIGCLGQSEVMNKSKPKLHFFPLLLSRCPVVAEEMLVAGSIRLLLTGTYEGCKGT